ncbi:cold-shock protein [Reinekea sp. G2M2-21]|uniref:cold-shock protein n=1 Tax=Reinekea sp. G2M2-21 TaxID=2788942 RepID=UPI00272AEAF3|nr:cold shock domain-containing protein [Reinekea sp. G2M2-21]
MKFKLWLVRLGAGVIVAAVAPVILAGALSVVPGLQTLQVSEILSLGMSSVKTLAYVVVALVVLVLVILYQAIAQPLVAQFDEDDREEGQVKWFNVSKGFGFVTRESGEDVFVHFRSIRGRGHRSLQEGQRVRFGVVESSKGLQAEDVTIMRQK